MFEEVSFATALGDRVRQRPQRGPDLDLFEPTWQIGAPRLVTSDTRVGLAEETMTQPRSAKVKDILSKANVPPDKPLKDNFRDYLVSSDTSNSSPV